MFYNFDCLHACGINIGLLERVIHSPTCTMHLQLHVGNMH